MSTPNRIQRRRTRGWKMPENTISVCRPGKWGNPFRVGATQIRMPALDGSEWEHEGRLHKTSGEKNFYCTGTNERGMPVGVWHQIEDATAEQCVILFREYITGGGPHLGDGYTRGSRAEEIRTELAGKNLACWCPEGQPCHADVLLELANQELPA